MSAMIGSCARGTISRRASAAWWSGTAGRTISHPASFRAAICSSVARTSRVSVLVIVWTAMGAAPPTTTSPTRTGMERRRLVDACDALMSLLFLSPGPLPDSWELAGCDPLDVEESDQGHQRQQGDKAGPLDRPFPLTVEGPAAHLLQHHDEHAAAVEGRQRQQVGQAEGHREEGGQREPGVDALGRGLVGEVAEADRPRGALLPEEAAGHLTGHQLVHALAQDLGGDEGEDGPRLHGVGRRENGGGGHPDQVALLLLVVARWHDRRAGPPV